MAISARLIRIALLVAAVAALPVSTTGASRILPPPGASVSKSTFQTWVTAFEGQNARHASDASGNETVFLNSLVLEQSPYLQQHANNPVNWVGWSEKSLASARADGALIFLSIGYSTCHWCHVMNRESFSDPAIAGLINRNFVAIKVDREELPVVDQHYSNTLAMVKGSAGWPLTAVLDSDGNVVVIDAYLDPAALTKILDRVAELAQTQPEALEQSAQFIASSTGVEPAGHAGDKAPLTLEELSQIADAIVARMDPEYGGLAGQQKFPNEALLDFLLTVEARQRSVKLRDAIALQLTTMATGGLYDIVNGGFFRYSTEPTWRNPHYEKMLYNQAQLLRIFSEAYARFGMPLHAWVVRDVTRFLDEWLYQPGQGFFSAIDAESAGVEGGYYLWRESIVERAGGEAGKAAGLTSYTARGKEPLRGVLLAKPETPVADTIRNRLLRERDDRPRPFIDKKILAAWNAAVLSGLAAAYWQAPPGERVNAFKRLTRAGDELWAGLYDPEEDRLVRTSYAGERTVPATLEDYAFMLTAMIDVYDVSADQRWLKRAAALSERLVDEFLGDNGYFRMAGRRSASSIGTDPVALNDAELPAADAVALGALWKLWKRQGGTRLKRALEPSLAALRQSFRAEPYQRLYAGKVLANIDLGSVARRQYFAGGRGRVAVEMTAEAAQEAGKCDAVTISATLADGWHVNSSEPLQDYLRPTAIRVSRSSGPRLRIEYPEGRVMKLGFQDEALSVYDGQFEIVIASEDCSQWVAGAEINIDLQACSDKVCLLPEVLRVQLPGFDDSARTTAE